MKSRGSQKRPPGETLVAVFLGLPLLPTVRDCCEQESGITTFRGDTMNLFWNKQTLSLFLLGAIATTVGIGIAVSTRSGIETVIMTDPQPPRPSAAAREIFDRHSAWAEQAAEERLALPLITVQEFFSAARGRTRPLAESILGWRSKWHLGSDWVRGSEDHPAWLQAQFEVQLFSEQELQECFNAALSIYFSELKEIESEFLLRVERDLEALSAHEIGAEIDVTHLRSTLHETLAQCQSAAQADLQATVAIEALSWVTGELMTVVIAQLSVSAGLIGAGASTSWATFGLGLVASVAADYAINKFYDYQFAPTDKLQHRLIECLDIIEATILDGDGERPGLKQALERDLSLRKAARRQALQETLLMPAGW